MAEGPVASTRAPTVPVRLALAVVVAAGVAAFGALALGEYEFAGAMPYVAGPLFGLAVGEVMVVIARRKHPMMGLVAAALAAGGVLWAGVIDTDGGLEPLATSVWPAAALGAVTAASIAGRRGAPRR